MCHICEDRSWKLWGGATMDTSNDCFLGIPTAIACESEVYGQVIGISELQKAYPEFFRSSLSH